MTSPELNHAIDHTTLSRLQNLLKKVCDTSEEARAIVEEQLLATPTTVIDLTDEHEHTPTTYTGVKRQRYAMCEHCKEEFDVLDNDEDSCQYHDGVFASKYMIDEKVLTEYRRTRSRLE
jgi:hypothetical protein